MIPIFRLPLQDILRLRHCFVWQADITSRRGCLALGTRSLSSPFILIVILF